MQVDLGTAEALVEVNDSPMENKLLETWKHTAPEIGLRTVLKGTNRRSSACLCVFVSVLTAGPCTTAAEKRRGVNESDRRCKLCAL